MDLTALAAGIAILAGAGNAIGEGWLCAKAMEGIARNPEAYPKLRTAMILGCALVETTGIYALLVSLLILFVK
ncbi:MAG: ATP synthase F0 subunit C [Erysipelotrichaceae bacterium]|nr:ATP synthase F0 subunit C [Erysipelotrichaceae bacterium]